MKPFHSLTPTGKARRLRRLAMSALQQYDIEIERVRLLGMYTNAIFRVDAVSGERYALRVCAPEWRTDTDLVSEALWLRYLGETCDLGTPVPIAATDGSYIITATTEGVPPPGRCLLMSWIPGALLGRRLNSQNLVKMGQLFARLHTCSAGFVPPAGFTTRRMDRVLARDETDCLFSEACRETFTAASYHVFCEVRTRVEKAYADLYADSTALRVIHHDLHHDNIKLFRGRLHPIDFEDTVWGYPVQDIAMAMQDLMTDVEPEQFELLQAAFRQGYETLRPWPESYAGQIDTFRAGRMLWVANYVARCERPHLAGFIARTTPLFAAFLTSGKLRRNRGNPSI